MKRLSQLFSIVAVVAVLSSCGGGGGGSSSSGGGGTGPDVTAPSVPTGVTVKSTSSGSNLVQWNASSDDVGVTGYKIYRNGGEVGTSATTSYTDGGLTASTTYSYSVAAYDDAANLLAQTPAVTVRTLAELVPAVRTLGVFVPGWHWGLEYWSQANDDDLIQSARNLGVGVIHLFLPPFETSLGVYDETHLVKLDHFLASASDKGVYVMISFINIYGDVAMQTSNPYWNPSGIEGLMADGSLKTAFKNRIAMLMNRQNTINNRLYKDDPTIAAWIIGDEPISDPNNYPTGQAPNVTVAAFAAWLEEMAEYVKGIDPSGAVSIFIQPAQSTLTDGDWTASIDVPSVDFVYAEDADMRILNHFDPNAATDYSQRLFQIGKPVFVQLAFSSGAWDQPTLCSDYTTQGQYIHDGAIGYFDLGAQSVIVQNWGTDLYSTAIPSFAACYTYTDSNLPISNAFTGIADYIAPFYFPHVATILPWQTEIALINTSPTQSVTGTLRGFNNEGQPIETMDVTLSPRGRRQIAVADEFQHDTEIGYIVFNTDSNTVVGYTKFYQEGIYRAAIPAVKDGEINTSDIYVSHIASDADWWTGLSLVNTTSASKDLTITFNDGRSKTVSLAANGHDAFTIADLFSGQPQPNIKSAVITNASGIIGLELFGGKGYDSHLDGLLLTGKTASTIYYPHVDSNGWWTGIVAYNPSSTESTITITPYSQGGTALSTSTLPLAAKEKYVGLVSDLDLPAETAWFKIDSTQPLSGFELFSTTPDEQRLAAYAGGGGTGAKEGVFAKIEKDGWTGIAFVNTEEGGASITLTAYNDSGTPVATQPYGIGSHAKVVNMAETIFSPQDISSATYITYSSDKNVVGFQLNNSSDDTMLDGLPALAGGN